MAPLAPGSPPPPPALADGRAEAAIRWRVRAATIDNLIVYAGYMVLCALLHWRVQSLNHLVVLGVAGIAYHFVLEARSGQTVGKRRYGIRVVSVHGGAASPRAIAIRSLLRIVDQLPVCYASGLVSMVRTGPARRQRIGDVAAGTMVLAVDGRAAAKGTPGWLLPTATILAIVVSAACAYALTEGGRQALDSTQRSEFIAGCQNGPAGPHACSP